MDFIWARVIGNDEFHLYFDCGDGGYKSLSRAQAQAVIDDLMELLHADH